MYMLYYIHIAKVEKLWFVGLWLFIHLIEFRMNSGERKKYKKCDILYLSGELVLIPVYER